MTDSTTPEEVQKAKDSKIIYAFKYYPSGATTNSQAGVTDIKNIYRTLVNSHLYTPRKKFQN